MVVLLVVSFPVVAPCLLPPLPSMQATAAAQSWGVPEEEGKEEKELIWVEGV